MSINDFVPIQFEVRSPELEIVVKLNLDEIRGDAGGKGDVVEGWVFNGLLDANGVWSAGNDGCCCLHLDGGAIVGVKLLQVPIAFAKGVVKHFLRSREGEDCSVPLVG